MREGTQDLAHPLWGGAMLRKVLQVGVTWAVALVLLSRVWEPLIRLPHIWFLVLVSILANLFQPAYRLFEGSRTADDRATGVQIVWTVYLIQITALLELIIKRPESLLMDSVSIIALVIMFGGLALRTWSVLTLGKFFTWNVEVQDDQHIVERGPYRLIRHPSYTGAFMTFIASCFLLHSWIAGTLGAVALLLAFLRRIRHEERLLRATFSEYDDYAARTGALLPRLF